MLLWLGIAGTATAAAPTANNDAASTAYNAAVNVDVTANDIRNGNGNPGNDIDDTSVALVAGSQSGLGTFSVNGTTGIVTFTPVAGTVVGTPVTIRYTVQDRNNNTSNQATITITVTNTAPTAAAKTASVASSAGRTQITSLTATDPEGNATVTNYIFTVPANTLGSFYTQATGGTALSTGANTLSAAQATTLYFQPNNSGGGTINASYTARDNANPTLTSASVSYVLSVVGAPVANDDVQSVSYKAATNINVLSNDGGGGLDNTTVTLVQGASTATSANTAGLPGTNSAGTFTVSNTGVVTFTPVGNYTGTTSIKYTVKNTFNQTSNQGTITLTVANSAPVAVNNTLTNFGLTAQISVLANDTDADGNSSLKKSSVLLIRDPSEGSDTGTSSIRGTNSGGTFSVDKEGVVTFVPRYGFTGTTVVRYTVKDELGLVSNQGTISVTVDNAAPVAQNDVVYANATTKAAIQIRILGNDTDANGDLRANTVSLTRTSALNVGTFAVDATTGIVTFTPGTNFTTSVPGTATYTVKDANNATSNTATITVNGSNSTVDVAASLSGPTTAPAGSYVLYTLTLSNLSTTIEASAQGRIVLPPNLTSVTASDDAVYDPNTGLVQFPTGNLGTNASRTHTVRFLMPALFTVSAVGSGGSTNTADNSFANNDGSAANAQVTTTPSASADVAATITGPAAAAPGARTILNIVASNYGPSVAQNVVLTATVNKNLGNPVVSGGGSYNPSTGVLTFPAISSLASEESSGFTFTFDATQAGLNPIVGKVTSSSDTPDPIAGNNDGTAGFSNVTVKISNTVSTQACLAETTTDQTTATGQQPNSYYRGLNTATANTTTLTVGPAMTTTGSSNIVPGDLILIMQMQGAQIDNSNSTAYGDGAASSDTPANGTLGTNLVAGQYEYRYVAGSSATATTAAGGTLTLASPLTNTYTNADATATSGQLRYQVIRVPRYRNLTLGADIVAPNWDGRTGGVVVLEVSGTLNFNGRTIDASGKGFRGGAGRQLTRANGTGTPTNQDYVAVSDVNVHASKGEGIAGTPRYVNNNGVLQDNTAEGYPGGSYGRGAPGNAGGGGTDGSVADNQNNTGGGGGANGGFGGQGGNAWNLGNPTGGNGGAPFLQANASRVVLGGGGGAGTTNNGTGGSGQGTAVNAGFNSSGVAGGGIVIINAATVSGTGTINVNGLSQTSTVDNDGSGGGGAGGSVVILSKSALNNITVLANGGDGGSNNLAQTAQHGPGGGGSAGVVFASSALGAATELLPGNNGLTGSSSGTVAFGSTDGTQFDGLTRSNIVQGDVPNITQASNCQVAPLPVTLKSFEATAKSADAFLTWSTAQELNNAYFVVERSFDGKQFVQIGQKEGHGTTNTVQNYTFTDAKVSQLGSQAYYRLRQVDTDGKASLTSVRVVSFGASAKQVELSPNPAADVVYVDLSPLAAGSYTATITDMTGRKVLTQALAWGNHAELFLGKVAPGAYLIVVTGNDTRVVKRLIKR
ncbi:Ig-like domain-containing protein [Hymenobacter busanensis]|uniref:Ig-like domain-containing protein n=1 Tax=Hymenobacter busanensis TaxID=2607656 RepID=UPI0013676C1F|nr:Ig-like domain-containing protein [Hymenobacter busanensis]QHJ08292.1 T9SS type A sorting domain-containing protein [Hymenobacter busanensis]